MKFPHLASLAVPILNLPPKANSNSDDEDGATIDMSAQEHARNGLALVCVGAVTGGATAYSAVFTLEESDDDSTWTAVSGKTATITNASTDKFAEISFDPSTLGEYLRLNRTVSITGGSSPTLPTCGVLMLAATQREPA